MTIMSPRWVSLCAALCFGAAMAQAQAQDAQAEESKAEESKESSEDVTQLSDIQVTDSPLGALGQEVSGSALGFAKPLLDTPRSVSFITTDQIDLFGVSSVHDLARVVPGVFTNTRRGYEGEIMVRGTPGDTYYRGMRRLNMQGHTRTVLGSMDSIEIVKGPPSPIFGMGRIGGYTNLNPKAGRAKVGGYLPQAEGFAQATIGSFEKNEMQFGVGGPVGFREKRGGYYAFGLIEDSAAFTDRVTVQQKYLQASLSVDEFIGPFRLEVGTQYQRSKNKGQILTRITQDVIDTGRYVRGTPLAELDTNSDGRIGFTEMHQNSPVRNNIGAANQPLAQRWAWPRDSAGNFYALGEFPQVAGIPVTMLNYLNAHPEIDCQAAQVMRGMAAGSPLPTSGQLPVGFVLNPCTTGYATVDIRANPTLERDQDAKILLLYADMIWDVNPDFTVKNQVFYDGMDQHKIGDQPFAEFQNIYAIEDKITVTRRIPADKLPGWVAINMLGSVNFRYNRMDRKTSGGDYDFRNDATLHMGDFTALTTFWTPADDVSLETGYPFTTINTTQFTEAGAGLMFDMDFFRNTNLVLGARWDTSDARNTDYADFNATTGTSANPGLFTTDDVTARGSDSGDSWSVSLSQKLPFGIRPYATYARSSITLAGSSQQLGNATILSDGGHIGEAELKEAGIKSSLFGDRLFMALAYYEQSRFDVTEPDDPSFGAEVSSSITEGWEWEFKYAPMKDLFIGGYATYKEAQYVDLPVSANINIDARTLGFMDVLDPLTGEVLYPAEAFLYGGRPALIMPGALASEYGTLTGNPDTQYGLNANWQASKTWGFNMSANWFDSTFTSRIRNVELPSVFMLNGGITFAKGDLNMRLSGFNLLDKRWFRARNGYTTPDVVNPQPNRYWQLTVKYDF
jgi:outer membrane receptor protein involved in Fe transport